MRVNSTFAWVRTTVRPAGILRRAPPVSVAVVSARPRNVASLALVKLAASRDLAPNGGSLVLARTAYDVRNFHSTIHKCYFVQDFEPWFYASGSAASFAEETYRFGFVGITAVVNS